MRKVVVRHELEGGNKSVLDQNTLCIRTKILKNTVKIIKKINVIIDIKCL